jgi:hypothetical protein
VTLFNCSVVSPLAPGAGWVYSFPGSSSSPGDFTATVALSQPDSNPANDADDAPISVSANPIPVLDPVDVTVNISVTPDSGVIGTNLTYTVTL